MSIFNFTLDEFVSQELSQLTACAPESLINELPDREYWFKQYVLRRIFHNHVSGEKAALAWALLRRTDAAIDEWEMACATSRGDLRQPAVYFKLLRHLENCVAALWQGLEFGRKAIGRDLYQKNDGTVFERLNWVYNVSRHFVPNELPPGQLHRVWLTNDGLRTQEHAVSFDEMREKIKLLARVVDKFAGAASDNEGGG